MAVRRGLVVDRAQVRIAVVVAADDVVDRICARTAADVADPAVIAQDPLALGVPFLGKPGAPSAALPLSGSHAYPSRNLDNEVGHLERSDNMTVHEPPEDLIRTINWLQVNTGVEPEVVELATHRWRIIVQNERVYMEMDIRRAKRERYVWLRSALIVDGVRRQNARDSKHFVRIFHDPDNALPPEGELDALLPAVDPTTAPPIVRGPYMTLARRLGAENVHIGNDGRRWVIGIDGPKGGLRLRFVKAGRRTYPTKRWVQVVKDGRDYSDDVNNDLEQAMALLSAPATGPVAPGTEGATADGSGFGSVGVRRHSVMRN